MRDLCCVFKIYPIWGDIRVPIPLMLYFCIFFLLSTFPDIIFLPPTSHYFTFFLTPILHIQKCAIPHHVYVYNKPLIYKCSTVLIFTDITPKCTWYFALMYILSTYDLNVQVFISVLHVWLTDEKSGIFFLQGEYTNMYKSSRTN